MKEERVQDWNQRGVVCWIVVLVAGTGKEEQGGAQGRRHLEEWIEEGDSPVGVVLGPPGRLGGCVQKEQRESDYLGV